MYISVYNNLGTSTESSGGIFNPQPSCSSWSFYPISASYRGKLLAPSYLTSITTPNVKLSFNRSKSQELRHSQSIYNWNYSEWNRYINEFPFLPLLKSAEQGYPNCLNNLIWYKLDDIIIKTKDDNLLKKIKFAYNNDPNKRLMLNSIKEESSVGQQKTYTLQYNQAERLPEYLSNRTDHWGFYNNIEARLDASNYYALRDPNPSVLSYGVLEKITYPTGGYTHFIFEPHSYKQQLSFRRWERCELLPTNKIAGGLRIKKITQNHTGNPQDDITEKEYFYVTDYLTNKSNANVSSGVLGGQIQYGFTDYTVFAFNDRDVRTKMSIFSSQSVLPSCINSQGSHIGYNEVIEKEADGSFTRFQFTNFNNGHMDEPADAIIQESRTPYEAYASKACERGKTTAIEEYSSDGKEQRVKKFQYEKSSGNFVRVMKARYRNVCPGTAVSYDEGISYKIYTYTYRLNQEVETVYNTLTTPISITKNYSYNQNGLIKEISQTVNNGIKKVTYKRTDEYHTGIYPSMVVNNILSPVIEETESFLDSSGNLRILRKKRTDYTSLTNMSGRIFAISSIEDSIGSSNWRKIYQCLKFDQKGNPVSVLINEKPVVYQWGYNGLYPVAIFENALNNHKVTAQYQDVWTTRSVALKYSPLYVNKKSYNFYTSKNGPIEFHLSGALGYNWYVSGSLDGNNWINLVQLRSSESAGQPWSDYQNAYTHKVIFNYVSAGYHTFIIQATEAYKGSYGGNDDGSMYYSYWGKEEIAPEITGNDDVFYENFESGYSDIVPFGFYSSKSYADPYTVSLTSNPSKRDIIDYQVFKDGKWNYTKHDFENGAYTIDEDNCPIDDVRVYPKDATAISFNHIPLIGLRSKTDERGITESYEYDAFGRLAFIKDNNQNIVKKVTYNYYDQLSTAPTDPYYSIELRKHFTRDNCDFSLGEIGQSIDYVVPARKYNSLISQEDANKKAYDDLMNNGQQYANENGECSSNIIIYVYNPDPATYTLAYDWGYQGNIRTDYYIVPPSSQIADTGDILKDFTPVKLYIPRMNYRQARMSLQDNLMERVDFSIKSTPYDFDIFYDINYFPGYEDVYVIGSYPFSH